MSENIRERLQFTFLMAIGMVLGMATYNTYLRTGGFDTAMLSASKEFFLAYPIALLIGSPLAKKLTERFWPKSLPFGLGMGIFTPIVMVPIMTCVIALAFHHNYALTGYFGNVLKNFLCAWPLQLLIVGPTVRRVFKWMQDYKLA